tara:strand:- start:837 stop:992 length:156 start_codon:yes stop_codon:yes gene_type:complete
MMDDSKERLILDLLALDDAERKEVAVILLFSLLDDLNSSQVIRIAEIIDEN